MPIYDVENRFSYYKSYSDNILIGDEKPTIGSNTWVRGVVGSVVSGSLEYLFQPIFSKFIFEAINPFFRSGEVRYRRFFSANQTIQDSVMPDILALYQTGSYGSGSIVSIGADPAILGGNTRTFPLLFSKDGKVVTGSNSERINNIEWVNSYPFEKKYELVNRNNNFAYDIEYSFDLTPTNANIFTYSPPFFQPKVLDYQFVLSQTSVAANLTTSVFFGFNAYTLLVGLLVDFYYGSYSSFDERYRKSFVFGIKPSVRSFTKPFNTGVTGSTLSYITGSFIDCEAEGWKYGIYNAIPTNFSCVFRQNHYGQFRDMLEGRPYTQTYNNPVAGGPLDKGITFVSGSALAGESNDWLTASIYNNTNVVAAYTVNPYGSGIYDNFYRSSQPWFDNDPRL